MTNRTEGEAFSADERPNKMENATVSEQDIVKQHQFQMFPTPDEKRASKVITRLDD